MWSETNKWSFEFHDFVPVKSLCFFIYLISNLSPSTFCLVSENKVSKCVVGFKPIFCFVRVVSMLCGLFSSDNTTEFPLCAPQLKIRLVCSYFSVRPQLPSVHRVWGYSQGGLKFTKHIIKSSVEQIIHQWLSEGCM